MQTRKMTAALTLLMLSGVIVLDLACAAPPNPWQAPPAFALGSGLAASGAHCAAVPGG